MIKVYEDKNGAVRVEIKGNPIEIQGELRCLGKSMLNDKDIIEDAYVVGVIEPLCRKYSKEEVLKRVNSVIKATEIAGDENNNFVSFLKKLFGE